MFTLWIVRLYLNKSYIFCLHMCGSGSRKLMNTDPIRIRIHNTGYRNILNRFSHKNVPVITCTDTGISLGSTCFILAKKPRCCRFEYWLSLENKWVFSNVWPKQARNYHFKIFSHKINFMFCGMFYTKLYKKFELREFFFITGNIRSFKLYWKTGWVTHVYK